MKYAVALNSAGMWAVWKNRKSYFVDLCFFSPDKAKIAALKKEGAELFARLEDIQAALVELGAVDPRDPTGWRV